MSSLTCTALACSFLLVLVKVHEVDAVMMCFLWRVGRRVALLSIPYNERWNMELLHFVLEQCLLLRGTISAILAINWREILTGGEGNKQKKWQMQTSTDLGALGACRAPEAAPELPRTHPTKLLLKILFRVGFGVIACEYYTVSRSVAISSDGAKWYSIHMWRKVKRKCVFGERYAQKYCIRRASNYRVFAFRSPAVPVSRGSFSRHWNPRASFEPPHQIPERSDKIKASSIYFQML